MLSGRGLCYELITRPEESYRLWRVVVCDLEISIEETKSPLNVCEYEPTMGCDAKRKKMITVSNLVIYFLAGCELKINLPSERNLCLFKR